MKINIVDEFDEFVCSVDVSPTDTIWTLKWKLYWESLRGASERYSIIAPSPDDQTLFILPRKRVLSQCDKTMEFYHIHEGSKVTWELKSRKSPQNKFRKILNIFRKIEGYSIKFEESIDWSMTLCVKHACCHTHEVRVLDLSSTGVFITPYSHLQHCIIFIVRLICKI
jgi:hypothetical protein